MASRTLTVPADSWVQVTNSGEVSGQVYHRKGNAQAVYTESATLPPEYDESTPTSSSTTLGKSLSVYGVPIGEFLWCRAISGDAELTFTPAEV